jgi:hypothetical protein
MPTPTTPTDTALPTDPLASAGRIAQRTVEGVDTLERAARTARLFLRKVGDTLPAAIASVELFRSQQDPGWCDKLVAREAARAGTAIGELDDALAATRILLKENDVALRDLAAVVAGRRSRVEVLMSASPDPIETRTMEARLAHDRLRVLAEQVQRWLPVATETAARLAQATVIVLRRRQVESVTAQLERLRAATAALRAPDPHDAEATATLDRLAQRLGRDLPVPVVRWPEKSGDPFAAPVIVEPGA